MNSSAQHTFWEDAQALVTATLIIMLGILLLKSAHMVTGGTTGLALLADYALGWRFGVTLFVINLPFYWLGWRSLGRAFTVKTFAAVALLSLWSEYLPDWLVLEPVNPVFAALLSGMLIGTGMLMLIRHQASLGGVGILAIYLQKSRGWHMGKVQMAVDGLIVLLALIMTEPMVVLYSLMAMAALNAVLLMNHKPGRYRVVP